jgi:hypothetical protein
MMGSRSRLAVKVGDGPNDLPWLEVNGQRLATGDHIDDAGRVAAIIAGVDPAEVDRIAQEVRMDFIREARQKLQARLDDGTTCPCCGQFAKRYKRKLNSSMAAALCWMWTHARDAWIEVPTAAPAWILKAREYPKLGASGRPVCLCLQRHRGGLHHGAPDMDSRGAGRPVRLSRVDGV